VAFIEISGSELMTPMQLGPIIRTPARRTRSFSSRSSFAPSSPVSLKPALITTRPLTPASMHSPTTGRTESRGTMTTARSIGSGTAAIDG
jgi:hypothetical protein